jgi:hypothetical protein
MKLRLLGIALIAVALFSSASAFGQEKGLSLLSETRFFSVYAPREADLYSLLSKIEFEYLTHLTKLSRDNPADIVHILNKTLDALYLEVSDILDIHVYSFHGAIKFLPDQLSVARVFREYFEQDFDERSFYLHERSTIYISLEDVTLGMLGHEIAHAIISHYFVVPPPVKTQEVLSGYVEYSLRKATGTLPSANSTP